MDAATVVVVVVVVAVPFKRMQRNDDGISYNSRPADSLSGFGL